MQRFHRLAQALVWTLELTCAVYIPSMVVAALLH